MSKRYPGGIIRKTPPTPSQTSAQGIWDMASVTQAVKENTWPIAGVPDPISKSLRFRSSASAYLNRTPASASNRRTFTLSAWVKRSKLGASQPLLVGFNGGSQYTSIGFNSSDQIYIPQDNGSGGVFYPNTNAVFRDPSAWYHVVVAFDTTQATDSNRLKVYVNGVQQTLTGAAIYPSQNADTWINIANSQYIGAWPTVAEYTDGYMTEVYLIDGQQLTPSSFGSTNDQTGVWQPIAYTGTYGTNGFYLPFSNTASTTTLGYDFSGNSNNWTPNNISLTSGSTYDSMVDVPTQWIPYNTAGDTGALFRGNYATLNPINGATATVVPSNGNLTCTWGGSQGNASIGSTLSVSSGKWYFEATLDTVGGSFPFVGIIPTQSVVNSSTSEAGYTNNNWVGNGTLSAGDVVGIAFDLDTLTFNAYKNGTAITVASGGKSSDTIVSGVASWMPTISGLAGTVWNMNFGQRPFSYTPPAGFKTLCTTNLSTPTIGATATTQASKYMNAILYTGNSPSSQTVTTGFYPDLIWQKSRTQTYSNVLYDSVRGVQKRLSSNETAAESTASTAVTAFASTSFTTGADGEMNDPTGGGNNHVAWVWNANSGSTVTNTAGSITSTVSANTTAGFSIATLTTQSSGTGTFGHGLGVAPSLVICKYTSTTSNWFTWHTEIAGTSYLLLNTTAATTSNSAIFSAAPTSTVVNLGTAWAGSGQIVAYCFAQVAGYSAFGSYTGNGSTDGPFIFTGFRPKYVLIKASSTTGDWWLEDTTRNPYNAADLVLFPNTSGAESGSGVYYWDFLSNGFKLRSTSTGYNGSGTTYIYAAFAESPFKYALAR